MAYFPPLDKCLSGQEALLSWTHVLEELTSDTQGSSQLAVQTFLANEDVIQILIRSSQPFSKTGDSTKHDFETRTAPIQTSSAHSIEQLKSDALWLSKELDISDVAALRLTLTEYQSRPVDLLLHRILDENSARRTDRKSGITDLSDVVRHRRLLQIYLQESTAIKQLSALLISLDVNNIPAARSEDLWLLQTAGKVRDGQLRAAKGKNISFDTITEFERLLKLVDDPQTWPPCLRNDFVLHDDFNLALLQDMISNLRSCLVLHSQGTIADAETVLLWFTMMAKVRFLHSMEPSTPEQAMLANILQAMVSVFSAALLSITETIAEIGQIASQEEADAPYPRLSTPYITDDHCLNELNLIMLYAAAEAQTIVPALYAWAIIITYIRDEARLDHERSLQIEEMDSARHGSVTRRQSAMEQKWDSLQDRSMGPARDDPAQFFARHAVDQMQVYDLLAQLSRIITSTYSTPLELPLVQISRTILFDVLKESLPIVDYNGHVIESALALLAPESEGQLAITPQPALSGRFWADRTKCIALLFQVATGRFPYETAPLLKLTSALLENLAQATEDWTAVVDSFESLHKLTITLPDGFRGYTLVNEEEGANTIRLLQDLPIFSETGSTQSFQMQDTDTMALQRSELLSAMRVPSGTQGTIVQDSRPFIVLFDHSFSGLNYIGLLVATLLSNVGHALAPPTPSIDNSTAADAIELMVNILKGASDRDNAQHILDELSANLAGQLDIIGVITELLEKELLARAEQISASGSDDILIQCLRFIQVISQYVPERLWAYLAQSSLFSANNSSSALLLAPANAKDQIKVSRLIFETVELYQIAVDDALRGLVKRGKTSKARTGSRFDSPMDSIGDISERVITLALSSFTSLTLEILQGLTTRMDVYYHFRSEIIDCIASTFNRLLSSVYGVGSVSSSSAMKIMSPPAQLILRALAPDTDDAQPVAALIQNLLPLLEIDNRACKAGVTSLGAQQAQSTLQLALLLLRIAKTLSKPTTHLTSSLIASLPILAPLYALQAQFRKPVSDLLLEIIATIDTGAGEPVSIFSQIDQQQGTQFLHLLTSTSNLPIDDATDCRLWELFAGACRHNQQWFAMYLVTGVLPKDHIKEKSKVDKTALSQALDLLADIKNLNPERATAIVGFVAEAQKTWSWATSIVRAHDRFKEQALAWLGELTAPSMRANTADQLLAAREYHLASRLCDVLAVNVHASLELGDKKFCRDVLAKVTFLAHHAVDANGYNINLHRTLADNIGKRFAGFSLADLKRTSVNPGTPGTEYMYDTAIAGALLGHDESWQGTGRAGSQGFLDELRRANVNWSLYDAQLKLLSEWKILVISLANADVQDGPSARVLLETVQSCLRANTEANLDIPTAAVQLQTRADIMFTLLSKLSHAKVEPAQAKNLLYSTWSLVKHSPVDYVVADAQQDLTYYRRLLQILFLALRLSCDAQVTSTDGDSTAAVSKVDLAYESLLVDIMTKTVASGFRALCGNLHDSTDCAMPQDFALIIALAKAVLTGSSSRPFNAQIADAVAFSGVVRSASSLFSWSDRLAELTDDDPVYGELAIMFLTTISKVPQVAEQMAVENILQQLSSANLANYFTKEGGRGPFDTPGRMYVIWTDGFLPLCLNLVNALGGPVVGEVSSFLGGFGNQLKRAQSALQNASSSVRNPRAGALTLGMVNEARDLITLAQIIRAARQLGAAEGIEISEVTELPYDVKLVAEDLEASTKSSRSLKDRIVPVTAREVALYQAAVGGGDDNALQAAIVKEISNASTLAND